MGSGLDALLVHMVDVLEECESKIDPSIGPIIVGSIRWFLVEICNYKPGYKSHDLL